MQGGEARTDVELVARALDGSQEAFRQLVVRYERPIFSLIVRMVRNRELAEDLSQESFVKAYRALESYDPQRKFSSWLFKIAHNTAIDQLRRGRLETEPIDRETDGHLPLAETLADEASDSPHDGAVLSGLAEDLEVCLAELRPEYRAVVQLRFQEGLSYQEIAEILDMALGTVKTNLHRARKELAALLGGRGWGEGT